MDQKLKYNLKSLALTLGIIATTLTFALVDVKGTLYKTSILELPQHAPFDGTVYPVKMVPDWVNLNSDQRYAKYSELTEDKLIPIMKYDADQIATDVETLEWGNEEHNKIRNARITYSTPYMGSYELNGLEGNGSHLAVDIKIPEGTPIHAMANGTVTKASNSTGGFGHHIVLQHNNFPSLDVPNTTQTIYSSYSHMSELVVELGDVVTKGQLIGYSGETGTATTPHVHFQIDNSDAPWHPYWPFTFKQATDAGLNFFTAVNAGLGQEEAYRTTIHPMLYVQTFLDADFEIADVVKLDEEEDEDVLADVASDDGTEVVDEMNFEDEEEEGEEAEEPVVEGSVENEVEDEPTPEVKEVSGAQIYTDIPESSEYFEATSYLSARKVITGYPDGSYGPKNTVNRVEVLKFIIEGVDIGLTNGKLPFIDTEDQAWYAEYLYTGYEEEIVNGDPEGTYRPADTVNKAEFYKILFLGLDVDVAPSVEEAPFDDVSVDDWHAPYFALAKEYGIVEADADGKVYPSKGMARGDVAVAMWKLMLMLDQ